MNLAAGVLVVYHWAQRVSGNWEIMAVAGRRLIVDCFRVVLVRGLRAVDKAGTGRRKALKRTRASMPRTAWEPIHEKLS